MLDSFEQVVTQAEGGYSFFRPWASSSIRVGVFGLPALERRSSWSSIGGNLG